MAEYRKKPVVISAEQWLGSPDQKIEGVDVEGTFDPVFGTIKIPTLEGVHTASPGDWIITGVKGEHYPCKDEIFRMTYELVESAAPYTEPGDD